MSLANPARTIYDEACKILAQDNGNLSVYKDAAALLAYAIKTAGGTYPDAEAKLAYVYFSLKDIQQARRYAESALRTDKDSYQAQVVLTTCAFLDMPGFLADRKFIEEFKKLSAIFTRLCRAGLTDSDFVFHAGRMMQLAELAAEKQEKKKLQFVYESIAYTPVTKVKKTNEKDTELMERQRLIAQAQLATSA